METLSFCILGEQSYYSTQPFNQGVLCISTECYLSDYSMEGLFYLCKYDYDNTHCDSYDER